MIVRLTYGNHTIGVVNAGIRIVHNTDFSIINAGVSGVSDNTNTVNAMIKANKELKQGRAYMDNSCKCHVIYCLCGRLNLHFPVTSMFPIECCS